MYKYYFHIIDNEYGCEYDYQGYFNDHDEASRFLQENKEAGNIVTILKPYYEFVTMNEVPSIYHE